MTKALVTLHCDSIAVLRIDNSNILIWIIWIAAAFPGILA